MCASLPLNAARKPGPASPSGTFAVYPDGGTKPTEFKEIMRVPARRILERK